MLLLQTTAGLARLVGQEVHLLDIDAHLSDLVRADGMASIRNTATKAVVPFDEAEVAGLIHDPGAFIIVGLNYRAHCEEIGRPVPEKLLFGVAPGSAVTAAGSDVRLPREAPYEVDYEGEVGVLIGKRAEGIRAEDAWQHIAGIMPLNDVSARDVQAAGTADAVGRAKGFATFKPLGPWLATPDEFGLPLDIAIETRVNGELRQSGRTGDMVFSIPQIIEQVSRRRPLIAGDVICTGTPGGVAHGGVYPYLKAGDTVTVTLAGLPPLVNRMVE